MMKRRMIVAVLPVVALCAAMVLTSCNKETLKYTMENSEWTGTQHAVYMADTVEMIDDVALTLTFGKENCRVSGTLTELRDSAVYANHISFDYYGTYTYEDGEGVIKTDATSLSGGKQLTFSVADSSKLSLSLPANFLFGTAMTVEMQQRSSVEY